MNKLALLLLPLMVAGPAFAGGPVVRGQRNVYHEEYCYKNVEKYTPGYYNDCLLYTSPSPRDYAASRMPSSA